MHRNYVNKGAQYIMMPSAEREVASSVPPELWMKLLKVYRCVMVYRVAQARVAQDSVKGFQRSFIAKFYLIKWRGGITNKEILEGSQSIHFEAIHIEA